MAERPNPIEEQIQGERAARLGEAGKRVEKAMAALAEGESEDRLDEAATAVWYYMIVRESLRFYDHKAALDVYGVPKHVLARVGVIKRV